MMERNEMVVVANRLASYWLAGRCAGCCGGRGRRVDRYGGDRWHRSTRRTWR